MKWIDWKESSDYVIVNIINQSKETFLINPLEIIIVHVLNKNSTKLGRFYNSSTSNSRLNKRHDIQRVDDGVSST